MALAITEKEEVIPMKTYKEVDQLILDWAAAGKSKSETAVLIAEAVL